MPQTPTEWLGRTTVNGSTTGFQGQSKVIGLSNGNILVVFADDSALSPGSGRDIAGVIYNAEGNVVVSQFQVNTNFVADTEQFPSIAATNDGGFIIAYVDTDASGNSIRAERHNAEGTATDFVTVAADPGAPVVSNPSVAYNRADDSFFVTYQVANGADETIRGKKFNVNMDLVGAEVTLRNDEDLTNSTPEGDPFRNDTAILGNGTYVTVFDEGDISGGVGDRGIEVRLSSAAGINAGNFSVTPLNGVTDAFAKVAALSDGGFVVV